MPAIIQGARTRTTPADLQRLFRTEQKYDYPFGLDLKPGSDFHNKLRDMIMERAWESRRKMAQRYVSTRNIDNSLQAYIPLSEAEKNVRDADSRRPVSIVVPSSYATYQTLLTYMVAAFLQEPIFKYSGVGPEDIPGALILENLIQAQMKKAKAGLVLHTMFGDAYKYNCGITAITYKKDEFLVTRVDEVEGLFSRTQRQITDTEIRWEGNVLTSIDFYDFLPDPNFPIYDVQSMEYVGWVERTNRFAILRDEELDEQRFNGRLVELIHGESSLFNEEHSGRHDDPNKNLDRRSNETIQSQPVDKIVMYIDLIPREWNLSDENGVETWCFEIAGDEVILRAQPLGMSHGQKPIAVASPDFDGHSVVPASRLEMLDGMQTALNFLYNSRIANIRKAINNMLAVDPGIVNYSDVVDSKEGMLVRARRAVWGLGKLKEGIIPIPVVDVTSGNLVDMNLLMQLQKETSGAKDILSGNIPRRGERVSSFEAQQAARGALQWLEKDARIMWLQSMQDIAEQMASNVQDLMEQETFVRVLGKTDEELRAEFGVEATNGRIPASPRGLGTVNFDIEAHDGSIPGSGGDPASMIQFMQTITSQPELLQQFDVFRIAISIARRIGIKDATTWLRRMPIQAQVQSPEAIEQGVDAGNLVPATEGGPNGGF